MTDSRNSPPEAGKPECIDAGDPGVDDGNGIWGLTAALARAATVEEVAAAVLSEAPAAVGGQFANLAIVDREYGLVRLVNGQPGGGEDRSSCRWSAHDLGDAVPACEAIRTGELVLVASTSELNRRFPQTVAAIGAAGLSSRASVPMRSASGTVVGAVGLGWRDPGQFTPARRRRSELVAHLCGLALERALGGGAPRNEELARSLEAMPSAFFSINRTGRVIFVNTAGARLLDLPAEEIVSRSFFSFFSGGARQDLEYRCRRVVETKEAEVFELRELPEGSWYEVTAWPDAYGFNISFRDVGPRRLLAQQRTSELRQAEAANYRLRLLDRLSAELSSATTRSDALERLAHAVVPAMGDWCTIVEPRKEGLVRTHALHRDSTLDRLAQRLVGAYTHDYRGPSPGVVVYKSGEPLQLDHLAREIVSELDDSGPSAAYGRTLLILGDGPGLVCPIRGDGQIEAILTLVRVAGAPFSDAEVGVIEDAGRRVAVALDGARHLELQRATAGALQNAALPKVLPELPRLALAAEYRAASEGSTVGGDWYDVFELSSKKVALVVGDTAGHGLEAAAAMAQMRNELRAYLFGSVGPLAALSALDRLVAGEPGVFATVVCAEIDLEMATVRWASAGHPAPIVVGPGGRARYLDGAPLPMIGSGAADRPECRGREHGFDMSPGDRILLFTDGLFERRGIDLDLGLTHLLLLAEATHRTPADSSTCRLILEEMLPPWHEDDVCLLLADFV